MFTTIEDATFFYFFLFGVFSFKIVYWSLVIVLKVSITPCSSTLIILKWDEKDDK